MWCAKGPFTLFVIPALTRIQGHLIAETNQSGQILGEYIYLGDQLLA